MSDYKPLDSTADVLPVGLQPTPFGEVFQALQQVAADVWNVDPSVYRAGMAWLWYAVNHPDDLASDSLRALLVAALISEQAPLVKDWQTNAELVEYLRVWRTYSPTYAKLEAIFATFGARVEVRPISDAESQGVVPVTDRRLAFYLRVEEFDAERLLTLDEVYQTAVRATPLGARPVPYFALVGSSDVFAGPASAGLVRALWASEPAEPVTPPTPAYTEITLYMQSGTKLPQTSVTSSFVGDVDSTYCYQLYTDEECTVKWAGYDYSNDYVLGYYRAADGEWREFVDSVAEMPDSTTGTTGEAKFGYVLLDTGKLWIISNYTYSGTYGVGTSKAVIRIYPKEQQHYAAYAYGASVYGNVSIAQSTSKQCVSKPGSADYIQTPHQFPVITLQKILGAAGNELPLSQYFTYAGYDGTRFRIINKTTSPKVRTVVYTLEYPTYHAWVNLTGNTNINSGVLYALKDKEGNYVEYDSAFDYYPIAMIKYDGTFSSATYGHLNSAKLQEDAQGLGRLCFIETYGSASMSKVWYYKAPKSIRTTFGSAVTIPAGFKPVAVKCLKLFIKASSITKESGSTAPINFEYAGLENEFCTDVDNALFGVGVDPCINMYGFSNPSNFSLFMLSTDSSQTSSSYATSVSASKFNEDGYFVKGVAALKSNYNADTYAGYLQANPMMFVKYNQGVGLPFYFTIQRSMWSYENGVFSWLGNDTDTTDLAYWYKSAPDVQIILEKLPTT